MEALADTEVPRNEAIASDAPVLTIITVNYNSQDFLRLSLKSLFFLTRNPHKIVICDNGSSNEDFGKLRYFCSFFPNITLIARNQTSSGSMGHGEALNILAKFIDTPYGVILDADCLPLMLHWDQFLIDQIDGRTKIVGTPVAINSPNNKKPTDFPLMFLCLFETETFRKLGIDFRPKDISRQQDTGWELREKFLGAGFSGKNLLGENTRLFKGGPFSKSICDEYYTSQDHSRLLCSHLGRGSNPNSSKYARSRREGMIAYERDKAAWLDTCGRLIDGQIKAAAASSCSRIEMADCEICGPGPTEKILSAPDFQSRLPGVWDVVRCANCGHAFTSPRPDLAHMGEFHPEGKRGYRPAPKGQAPSRDFAGPAGSSLGFKGKVRLQLLRQHLGYFASEIPASPIRKLLTLPFRRRLDTALIPRFPKQTGGAELLEIGCSAGARLLELRGMGWNVRGIEPSDAAASEARLSGLDVQTCLLEEARFAPGEFDCIILDMVLQRLHHPVEALALIGGWLKPGGELLVRIPDFNGFEARVFGEYHYGLQVPAHLHHFTPKTLPLFLKDYRFKVVHEGSHRDLKSGLENHVKGTPRSPWGGLLRVPNKGFKAAAVLLAWMGRSSLMVIRAVKNG